MKRARIIAFACGLALILPDVILAQVGQPIIFTYDAAGNRVRREISSGSGKTSTDPGDTTSTSQATPELEIAEQGKNEEADTPQSEALMVYPNPTTGKIEVSIDLQEGSARTHIHVFDLTGKRIWENKVTGTSVIIDLTDHPAGTYLIRLITENDEYQKKIIKE